MLMPSDKLSGLLLHKDPAAGEAPPAPPPIQPLPAQHDPYSFITNPGQPAKKKLLPGGNSKMGRLVIAGGGAMILIMLALIVVSVLGSSGGAVKTDYLRLAQQQAELIRISDIGIAKARQSDAKNLAITTQYSLTSQQPAVLELAKKAGVTTDVKTLAAAKDAKTDAALTAADQSNKFDEVFIKTLLSQLQSYRETLKKIYDASSSESTRNTLSKDYDAVNALIGVQPKDGGSSSSPATN